MVAIHITRTRRERRAPGESAAGPIYPNPGLCDNVQVSQGTLDGVEEEAAAAPAGGPTALTRDRRSARAATAVTVLGGLCGAATLAGRPFDTDAWWHTAAGNLILDTHSLPTRDPFSWTAGDRHWQLNSWLWDVVVASLDRAGGRVAVSLLALAVVAAMPVVVGALARRDGARPWPAAGAALFTMYFLTQWAGGERPQTLSYVLFPIAVYLARQARDGSNRALAGLGVLMVAWSNMHLAFTAGITAIGLIAAFDALGRRSLRRPAAVVPVALVAGLCNPYFFGAYTSSLSVRSESKAAEIAEWLPLNLSIWTHRVGVLFVVLGFVALVRTGRIRHLDVVAPIVFFTVLTVDARRNMPFVITLVAVELALAMPKLDGAVARYAESRRKPLLVGAVGGITVVLVAALLGLSGIRAVEPDDYPVAAAAQIPSGCRLLNEYGVGGYLIDHRPDVRVSQDGRNNLYGTPLVNAQQEVLAGQGDWVGWLDANGVDCVLALADRPIVEPLVARGWFGTGGTKWVLLTRPA